MSDPSVSKEVNRALDRGIASVATPFRSCSRIFEVNFPIADTIRDIPHELGVKPDGFLCIMAEPGLVRSVHTTIWDHELAFLAADTNNTRALVVFFTTDPPLDRTRDVGPPLTITDDDCCVCVSTTLTRDQILSWPTTTIELVPAPDAGYVNMPLHGAITSCLAAGGYGNISPSATLAVMYDGGAKAFNFVPNDASMSTGSQTRLSDLLGATAPLVATDKVVRLVPYVDTEGVNWGPVAEVQDRADVEAKAFVLVVDNKALGDFTGGDPGDEFIITVCFYRQLLPTCGAVIVPFELCTDAVQSGAPDQANGVALTPNASAWTSSAWVPIFTPGDDIALTAIVWNQPDWGWTSYLCEFDIGTGAPGFEVVIGTLAAKAGFSSFTGMNEAYFPIPLGPIVATTPISIRLRKAGTSVLGWTFSLNYYTLPATDLPLISSVVPTPKPALGATVLTPSAVAWSNSAWVEVDPAIAFAWTVAAAIFHEGTAAPGSNQFELDIATGALGAEVVKTTLRGDHNGNFWGMGPNIIPVWPLSATLPAAERVSIRMRKQGTSTATWQWRLLVYPALSLSDAVTALPQTILPPAADSLVLPPNGAWGNGAWVQFSPALPNAIAVVGFTMAGTSADSEIDIGTGALGAEVVKTTTRVGCLAADKGGEGAYALGVALELAAGVRLVARQRTRNGGSCEIALAVIESPDFTFKTELPEVCWPAAGNATTPHGGGGAWTPGAWAQIEASAPDGSAIVAITYTPGAGEVDAEIQIGTGLAGFEVVKASLRVRGEANDTSHAVRRKLPIPLCLEAGDRVAVRIVEDGTSISSWDVALMVVPGLMS